MEPAAHLVVLRKEFRQILSRRHSPMHRGGSLHVQVLAMLIGRQQPLASADDSHKCQKLKTNESWSLVKFASMGEGSGGLGCVFLTAANENNAAKPGQRTVLPRSEPMPRVLLL